MFTLLTFNTYYLCDKLLRVFLLLLSCSCLKSALDSARLLLLCPTTYPGSTLQSFLYPSSASFISSSLFFCSPHHTHINYLFIQRPLPEQNSLDRDVPANDASPFNCHFSARVPLGLIMQRLVAFVKLIDGAVMSRRIDSLCGPLRRRALLFWCGQISIVGLEVFAIP